MKSPLEIALLYLNLLEATPELTLAIEETEQAIRNYCNFEADEDIPSDLNFIWASMAVGMIQRRAGNADLSPVGPLTSIREGDESYGFAAPAVSQQEYLDAVVNDYAHQLNKFRKLRWL